MLIEEQYEQEPFPQSRHASQIAESEDFGAFKL
jgi:hypothetical protein